ncbi:transcription antitermination factor NusB [Nanchangia anserum]|uniref:Transcription antitermination protein NusB n=1 Tax=Nanchangia anserum TaxID=2692125 RepID=A0A8I0GAX1_9ACTO|nr:transcription antitermination factor NusB [Nanchangia anserum]MBD3688780.1 transcription antitermination factor NusB [Nanchangia anserum]QOX82517.1 transcription antitermination factor NusB [Nanchangia anserum]
MAKRQRLTARTRARSRAVDTLFEAEVRGFGSDPESLRGLANKRREITTQQTPLPDYAFTIVTGVADAIDVIDDAIATHSHRWSLDRMARTDLAIMRVATWEILCNDDVPDTVAINEALTITRAISTAKSPGFVNAILDAIRRSKYTEDVASPASTAHEADDADTDAVS